MSLASRSRIAALTCLVFAWPTLGGPAASLFAQEKPPEKSGREGQGREARREAGDRGRRAGPVQGRGDALGRLRGPQADRALGEAEGLDDAAGRRVRGRAGHAGQEGRHPGGVRLGEDRQGDPGPRGRAEARRTGPQAALEELPVLEKHRRWTWPPPSGPGPGPTRTSPGSWRWTGHGQKRAEFSVKSAARVSELRQRRN